MLYLNKGFLFFLISVQLFADGSISMNQIGLAFTVIPAGMLMVLQYSIFKMGEYLFIHQLQNVLVEKLSIPP